jgi:hypothetical protein
MLYAESGNLCTTLKRGAEVAIPDSTRAHTSTTPSGNSLIAVRDIGTKKN